MSGKPRGREWAHEAQKLLSSLRDISSVDVTLAEDGIELAEINILAEGHRPPKQIVRDVRSALRAEYQIDVDYRKISVAQRRPGSGTREGEENPTVLSLPAAHLEEEPAAGRLRFEGVTVKRGPDGCRVMVELGLGDREAVGEAEGVGGGSRLAPLAARAALDAAMRFLDPGYSFVLAEVKVLDMGGEEVVVVALHLFTERNEKLLVGAAPVGADLQQGVVYATLAALNRILGRLRFREPVEYELRPTTMT